MHHKISIREVDWTDFYDILTWRNDNVTRSMSMRNDEITQIQHYEWFYEKLVNDKCQLYLALINGQKIGICWFEKIPSEEYSLVSINLNPSFRGKGLSFIFLKCAIQEYKNFEDINLIALINNLNLPSIKIFKKCGFIKNIDNDLFTEFILKFKN